MAAIYNRTYPSGRSVWKLTLRRRPNASFTINFVDKESAMQWASENECQFVEDSKKYFTWRDKLYRHMRRKNLNELEGIILPRCGFGEF